MQGRVETLIELCLPPIFEYCQQSHNRTSIRQCLYRIPASPFLSDVELPPAYVQTIVEAVEIRDSGRLSTGMTTDDRAAGEAGEVNDHRSSVKGLKGSWARSVATCVTDEGMLETGVRYLSPSPTSEARDADCMGSSALRLLDRILRKRSQAARMRSESERTTPTIPPAMAADGI